MAREHDRPTQKIVIVNADEWPELNPADVREENVDLQRPKGHELHATLLISIFGGLFVAYSMYAMYTADDEMLRSGFELVKLALTATVSWAFGRRSLTTP